MFNGDDSGIWGDTDIGIGAAVIWPAGAGVSLGGDDSGDDGAVSVAIDKFTWHIGALVGAHEITAGN